MTGGSAQATQTTSRAGSPALQGDEAELFARYQHRLLRATAATVRTSAANVDDACAFAWSEFLTRQPRRESALPWLRQVARREAIRLDGAGRRNVELDFETKPGMATAAQTPEATRRSIASAHGMLEVRERLADLPDDQRKMAFLRAAGWRYGDIADCLDLSEARVTKLLARADASIRRLDERDLATRSPRAARLKELEDDPPRFLVQAIGRPPRPDPKRGGEQRRLEWRRLALAVDDYRSTHNIRDRHRALGSETAGSSGEDRTALTRRIASFAGARGRSAGRDL